MPLTTRRHLLLCLVLGALVATSAFASLATSAGGADPPLRLAATSDVRGVGDVRRMLGVANDHWRERTGRSVPASCAAIEVREGGPATGSIAGYAEPPCRIWLNPTAFSVVRGEWRASLCDVVVHEVGHLLGREHSSRPHDVMAPELPVEGWPRVEQCALSVARTAR